MLTVLALIAACAGETTAPEAPATPTVPDASSPAVGLQVLPGTITLETNQRVRFRGQLRSERGELTAPAMIWRTTGGSIESDGTFHSPLPGTYHVTGRGRSGARFDRPHRPDTSVVVVVPRQPRLLDVRVSPRASDLAAGETRTFSAIGRLPNGASAPIGVLWEATGGTIDAAGVYEAGDVAGTYHVIASDTRRKFADTVSLRIAIVEVPQPAPTPTPDTLPGRSPIVTRLVLKPAAVLLPTQANHQFTVFGRSSDGDSVAVEVTFRATGGSISPTGLFTAGATAGTYRVIATSSALADTALVTLAAASGGGTPVTPGPSSGVPMGVFGYMGSGANPAHFTMAVDGYTAENIVSRLNQARARKLKIFLNMTGGHHRNYMTGGAFDMAKWQAKMNTYDTPAIKAAVAEAVAEGTIIGNSVMDEPANNTPKNSWGPPGTMTKARVDEMCRYVKGIFPTMPVGVVHDHRIFEPEENYQSCEFLVSQYRLSKGDIRAFRDGGLAFARRSGIAIAFSLNVIHGGVPGTTCDKWGDDPRGVLCPMTGDQVREWGLLLGPAGCALTMWTYYKAYFDKPEVQQALAELADTLAKAPRRPCTRT